MSFVNEFKANRSALAKTLLIYASFIGYYANVAISGSSLLDLQVRIQEPFSVTARIIPIHFTGYLVGAIAVGFMEKNLNHYFAISASSVLSGIFMILTPWMYDFCCMAFLMFCAGVFHAVFELVVHVLLVDLWKEKVGNYMQVLHMNAGIGSILAPLIVRPFLLPLDEEMRYEEGRFSPDDVQVQWAFAIIGLISVITGFAFLPYYFDDVKRQELTVKIDESLDTSSEESKATSFSTLKIYTAVLWVAIMASLNWSIETVVYSYAQAFGVKSDLRMEKKSSALVTTLFWACFIVSRIVFVLLSKIGRENLFIKLFIAAFSIGTATNMLSRTELGFWLSSALIGFGYSPLFAVAYSSLEKYFHLNGRITSCIFIFGVVGDATHALILGYIIDFDPNYYIWYLGWLSICFIISMLLLPLLCKFLFGSPKNVRELKSQSTRLASFSFSSRRNTIISLTSP